MLKQARRNASKRAQSLRRGADLFLRSTEGSIVDLHDNDEHTVQISKPISYLGSESQRTKRFVQVNSQWRQIENHLQICWHRYLGGERTAYQRLRISAQRVLKQVCELQVCGQ